MNRFRSWQDRAGYCRREPLAPGNWRGGRIEDRVGERDEGLDEVVDALGHLVLEHLFGPPGCPSRLRDLSVSVKHGAERSKCSRAGIHDEWVEATS